MFWSTHIFRPLLTTNPFRLVAKQTLIPAHHQDLQSTHAAMTTDSTPPIATLNSSKQGGVWSRWPINTVVRIFLWKSVQNYLRRQEQSHPSLETISLALFLRQRSVPFSGGNTSDPPHRLPLAYTWVALLWKMFRPEMFYLRCTIQRTSSSSSHSKQ